MKKIHTENDPEHRKENLFSMSIYKSNEFSTLQGKGLQV